MMLKNKEKTKRRNFATFSPEPAIKSSYKLLKEDILPKPSNFKIVSNFESVIQINTFLIDRRKCSCIQ